MALAGVIVGWTGLALIVVLVIVVVFFASLSSVTPY